MIGHEAKKYHDDQLELCINFNLSHLLIMSSNDQNQDHTDEILITLDDEELVECSLCSRSYPKFHRHEVFCPLNPGRAPCPACGYKFLSVSNKLETCISVGIVFMLVRQIPDAHFHLEECPSYGGESEHPRAPS